MCQGWGLFSATFQIHTHMPVLCCALALPSSPLPTRQAEAGTGLEINEITWIRASCGKPLSTTHLQDNFPQRCQGQRLQGMTLLDLSPLFPCSERSAGLSFPTDISNRGFLQEEGAWHSLFFMSQLCRSVLHTLTFVRSQQETYNKKTEVSNHSLRTQDGL